MTREEAVTLLHGSALCGPAELFDTGQYVEFEIADSILYQAYDFFEGELEKLEHIIRQMKANMRPSEEVEVLIGRSVLNAVVVDPNPSIRVKPKVGKSFWHPVTQVRQKQ